MTKKTLIIANFFINELPLFDKSRKYLNSFLIKRAMKKKIIPLFYKLKKEADVRIVPLDIGSLKSFCKHKIPVEPPKKYFTKKFDDKILYDSHRLFKAIPSIDSLLNKKLNHKGISMWHIEETDAWRFFIYRTVRHLEYIKKILEIEKPDHVYYYDANYINVGMIRGLLKKENITFTSIKASFSKSYYYIEEFILGLLIKYFSNKNLLSMGKTKSSQQDKLNNVDVLFFIDVENLSKYAIKLANMMKERGKTVKVIAVKDMSNQFNKENIEFRTFSSYFNEEIKKENNLFAAGLKKTWKWLKKSDEVHKKINYQGVNLWTPFKNMFQFFFRNRFGMIAGYINILERIFHLENPKVVVLFDDIGVFDKMINLTAQKKNIKVTVLQHGLFLDFPTVYTSADLYAAYGQQTKDTLVRNGSNPDNIKITGNIKFDDLKYESTKKEVYGELGILPDKKLVMVITEPGPENAFMIKETILAAKSMQNIQLLFKLHPGDKDLKRHKRLASKFNYNAIVLRDYDIYKLLAATDIVILTETSTVGLEAQFFDIPLLQFRESTTLLNNRYPQCYFYINEKAAVRVENKEEIIKAINNLLNDKNYRNSFRQATQMFIKKYAYKNDGQAKKRISDLIKGLVDSV